MSPSPSPGADSDALQVLWADSERVLCRGVRAGAGRKSGGVLVVLPAAQRPSPASLDRLAHEYALKDELEGAWALRPLDLAREDGRIGDLPAGFIQLRADWILETILLERPHHGHGRAIRAPVRGLHIFQQLARRTAGERCDP